MRLGLANSMLTNDCNTRACVGKCIVATCYSCTQNTYGHNCNYGMEPDVHVHIKGLQN